MWSLQFVNAGEWQSESSPGWNRPFHNHSGHLFECKNVEHEFAVVKFLRKVEAKPRATFKKKQKVYDWFIFMGMA